MVTFTASACVASWGPTPEVTWGSHSQAILLPGDVLSCSRNRLGPIWEKNKALKCADLSGSLNSPPSHLAEPGKSHSDITEQSHDLTKATLQGDTSGPRCRPGAAPAALCSVHRLLSRRPPHAPAGGSPGGKGQLPGVAVSRPL